jgi:RNA polymerase sigma-70 factor (ECF subfamily)
MTTSDAELKVLMLASLDGDAASHRSLLEQLSLRLRAYYKAKLAALGRGTAEAEDLVQETVLAIHLKRHTYDTQEPLTPWVHKAVARLAFDPEYQLDGGSYDTFKDHNGGELDVVFHGS